MTLYWETSLNHKIQLKKEEMLIKFLYYLNSLMENTKQLAYSWWAVVGDGVNDKQLSRGVSVSSEASLI